MCLGLEARKTAGSESMLKLGDEQKSEIEALLEDSPILVRSLNLKCIHSVYLHGRPSRRYRIMKIARGIAGSRAVWWKRPRSALGVKIRLLANSNSTVAKTIA